MSYMIGDTPAHLVFELPDAFDPDGYTAAQITLNGDTLPTDYDPLTGEIIAEPDDLDTAGILQVLARMTLAAGGGLTTIELPPIVVEDPNTGWATLDEARRHLAGADIDDPILATLLNVARSEVLAFAPALLLGAPIPQNYKYGQILHARNKLNAARTSSTTGDYGDGSFAIARYPLDWQVKQILRPQTGIPRVG